MADASYAVPHFLGGEISQFAQGRFDKPDYRTSLNVCFNSFPVEIGTWVRRPGTRDAGPTRGGAAGRVIKFDFEQASPYTLEFTDSYLRFRAGDALVTTNDVQAVVAISTANPAVVQTATANGWASSNTVIFQNLGTGMPLLQNRQFVMTVVDPTHFSLTDALTGATIDGATLGALPPGASVARVQELTTVYSLGSWANIRAVQAETTDILLAPGVAPQALTVTQLPAAAVNATFAIAPAIFTDGPYLDPVDGSTITPSAVSGLVNLSLSFQAYSATTAYSKNAYVLSSSIGYKSLQDANLNHTPASSPTFWQVVSPSNAVNDGRGFLATDIGRPIRLYNPTPASAWSGATTYNQGDLASATSISYRSLVSGNTNNAPATSPLFWEVYTPGWTWGRITALSTSALISGGTGTNIGDMTQGGGLASAFDGSLVKSLATAASFQAGVPSFFGTRDTYVGKNYTGSPQAISSAIVTPSTDFGFVAFGPNTYFTSTFVNLRGKATAPANAADGTLLGQATVVDRQKTSVTILSNDAVTTWNYVWIEVVATYGTYDGSGGTVYSAVAQAQFYNNSGAAGAGATVQILGGALSNTSTMTKWRLGVYSDTTGYPTCGTYQEGRLWLGGAVPNRFDASVSNGIKKGTIDFAPTDQSGAVAASNAISYVLNSDSVNPIFWFQPDLQGIIIGTQAGEWLVQAPTAGPIAPNNIAARRVTKNGCANVEPRRTENTNVFVQRYGQKLMEYFADVYSGKFSAPNLADKAQHISRVGIAELAYQQAVTPIIWGRGADGSFFGITYKRDTLTTAQGPTYAAWHPHGLGSGRVVESICAGPSIGGNLDTLTMVTNDPVTNIRHVELLTDTPDESAALADAWFLDGAVAPASTLSNLTAIVGAPYGGMNLYGLWHLNGKTVSVFAGGLDCGDFIIANGACFVPYGDGVSAGTGGGLFTPDFVASFPNGISIVVGFTYTSDGQLVRPIAPADTGARNGPALGKIRRNHRYAMLLNNALGISVGASFSKLRPILFKQPNGLPIQQLTTFSGVYEGTLEDDYSMDGMICWRITRPVPANIVAVQGFVQTQDK